MAPKVCTPQRGAWSIPARPSPTWLLVSFDKYPVIGPFVRGRFKKVQFLTRCTQTGSIPRITRTCRFHIAITHFFTLQPIVPLSTRRAGLTAGTVFTGVARQLAPCPVVTPPARTFPSAVVAFPVVQTLARVRALSTPTVVALFVATMVKETRSYLR